MNNFVIKIYDNIPIETELFFGYKEELNSLRNKIDSIDQNIWKTVRWIINDYDFLVRDPIINRAFYKYWEIVHKFNLIDLDKTKDCVIHLAEAPGGFIQVSQKLFNKNKKKQIIVDEDGYKSVINLKLNNNTSIVSMSLNKEIEQYKKYNLPSYNEKIVNKNVLLSYGIDNTGNLINIDNINHLNSCVKNLDKNIKIITADGGFDEGTDFNNKEQLHYSLIIHEILSMLILSNKSTNFVLKMYDTYTKTSVDMLYLLHKLFKSVEIFKPVTSRPTNSEKYIICKDLIVNEFYKEQIIIELKNLSNLIKDKKDGTYYFTLFENLPDKFVNYIININKKIIDNQCLHLKNAIYFSSLSKEDLKSYLDLNKNNLKIKKDKAFKEWCNTYSFT
jgi:23S rRNA U2552 (ribose-2'-O)-methylase RlmE/FtsJ